MRFTRFVCVLLAATFTFSLMAKQPKDKKKYGVYMVGVSASFTDSLVYFTDAQWVDSAYLDKGSFLSGRSQYSEQLSNFLSDKGMQHRTSFIFFNKKLKSLEKEVSKLKHRYTKEGGVLIQNVDPSFKFKKAESYQ